MNQSRQESEANCSLLYLQLVLSSFAALICVPLDLVGRRLAGQAQTITVLDARFALLSGAILAVMTFCAWRWIVPYLRGPLALRALAMVLLGLAMFSQGLMAARFLEARLPPALTVLSVMPPEAHLDTGRTANLVIVAGATLYMLLGAFVLGSAREEHQRLREVALKGRLEALRSQLNHHFLFNSLNVIAEAAAVQPERVEKLILQLAEVLRYSLGASRVRTAPLSEELAAVASYLELERARSGNRISVETEIAPEVGGITVPPLLIQPLVENAVGHGLMNGTCAGKISIAAWLNGDTVCIRVTDDGVGFDSSRSSHPESAGVGLPNLRDRLRAFYGDAAAFQIHSSADGGGTVAEVSLPRAIRSDRETPLQTIIWRTLLSSAASIASIVAYALALGTFNIGVARSLSIGGAIEVLYLLIAGCTDEIKTFDIAIAAFLLIGQVAMQEGLTDRFLDSSTTLLCGAIAIVAILSPFFGADAFTAYWMRRACPTWLQRGASFARVSRRVATFWGILFGTLAAASYLWSSAFAISPAYVASIGPMAGLLSAIYPRRLIHRAGLKRAPAEFFVLGLPLMFRRKAHPALKLSAQFVVSGGEPGSYYVEIDQGHCIAGQGNIKEPNLTIYCANDSWNSVTTGEFTPQEALARRVLRITGSPQQFLQFLECFSLSKSRQTSRFIAERHAA